MKVMKIEGSVRYMERPMKDRTLLEKFVGVELINYAQKKAALCEKH